VQASEFAERLWVDYQTFASRGLTEFTVLYLFIDGIAERPHLGQPREAVLLPRAARSCCSVWRRERKKTRQAVVTSCVI
jgi:hypothetical protein